MRTRLASLDGSGHSSRQGSAPVCHAFNLVVQGCRPLRERFGAQGIAAYTPAGKQVLQRRYTESALTRLSTSRALCAVAALSFGGAVYGAPHHPAPDSPWQIAEAARVQLTSIPPAERTVTDYRTVMDAYRLIYHGSPRDAHAPESIFNVGSLLEDEGVVLHDPRAMQASLGQFEFLRKQYPTSSLRIAALLEEARIAAAGLHDPKLAREKYAAFADQFPHSAHIDEAHNALVVLHTGALPRVPEGPLAANTTAPSPAPALALKSDPRPPDAVDSAQTSIAIAHRNTTGLAAASSGVPGSTVAPGERAEASLLASERRATPADTAAAQQQASTQQAFTQQAIAPQASDLPRAPQAVAGPAIIDAVTHAPAHTHTGLATVTGIRHWSTPTYTRVAIDLGDEVRYQAARVPHPDRIFFDLHGTDGFLRRIRIAQYSNDSTRVVLDVNDVTEYSAFLLPNPYRLIIDIHGAAKPTGAELTPAQGREAGLPSRSDTAVPSTVPVRTSLAGTRDVTALSQQPGKVDATAEPTNQPIAVVADKSPDADQEKSATARRIKRANRETANHDVAAARDPTADVSARRTAAPTAEGERSLMRALGLKIGRIVIDPGHGGHDSGTLGAGGIMEKDVVLDVALRLGKLLHDHLGAEIVYTRSDDTFIPLETRTAIANQAQADLFLSVHANSSQDETARGVETYYLNFTAQPDALDVAARENAVSDQSVHELASMVKKITLKDKIEESREFAQDVEQTLYDGLHGGNPGLKNRGVKKAPFVVLIGANMPSILTEISFVTNPQDAAELRTGEYRQRVAESIYRGVARYAQGLGGMRIAAAAKPLSATAPSQ